MAYPNDRKVILPVSSKSGIPLAAFSGESAGEILSEGGIARK
jgi:hypothetical protein